MAPKREVKTIQVFFRLRPPNKGEIERGDTCDCVKVDGQDKTVVTLGERPTRYKFHGVFLRDSKQQDVFESVAKNAVLDAFDGFIGLMFVYGQTGTGKTFTMSCQEPGLEGVFQRSMEMVFNKIKEDKGGDYNVSCTFIQIYQEVIQDLLSGKFKEGEKKGLGIREDPDRPGLVYCYPVKEVPLYSTGDTAEEGRKRAYEAFLAGDANRSVSATNMNATSSRSHTIFTLKIHRRKKLTDDDYDSGEKNEEFHGQLILVDLAGCERQKKTGTEGKGLGEANAINGSLLVLGKVIKALTDPKQHVPFRESKLTRLLQYPLSGKGRTTLIVTAGPSEVNQDETRSAIEFGMRAMTIKASAESFVVLDYKAEYLKLKAKLEAGADEGHRQALEEQELRYESLLEEKDEKIKELEVELGQASPGASPRSPRGGGGGGGDGDDGGEYKEKCRSLKKMVDQLKEELGARNKKLSEKREEWKKEAKERIEVEKKLVERENELAVVNSKFGEFGDKIFRKLQQLSSEKDRADQQLRQMKQLEYVSATGELGSHDFKSQDGYSDSGFSDDGAVSPREEFSPISKHIDPDAPPAERLQLLWEDRLRLGDRLRGAMSRADDLEATNRRMKAAIRYQAHQQSEGGDLREMQERLAKAEQRAEKYKRALRHIQAQTEAEMEAGDQSDCSTPGRSKEKKEKKHRRERTLDGSDADFSGLDDGQKKEKKDKKDKKAKD
eukprot:Hpha_TRINITY_DN15020_c7_g10::TRINITY_DN15020_c7_g10_i1::g.124637::m.124637/K10396/KIF5; kinesin family member 5